MTSETVMKKKEYFKQYYASHKEKYVPKKTKEELKEYRRNYYLKTKEGGNKKVDKENVKKSNRENYLRRKNDSLMIAIRAAEILIRDAGLCNAENIIFEMRENCKSQNDVKLKLKKFNITLV